MPLVAVNHDPFGDPPSDLPRMFTPVDHDPFDPLAASAGIAPAGPTPVGSAMLQGMIDLAAAPGRVAQGQQPQTPGQWSDVDEAIRQMNAISEAGWGAQTAMNMVGAPGGSGGLGSGVRGFSYSRAEPLDFVERMQVGKDRARELANRGFSGSQGIVAKQAPLAPKGSFGRLADETFARWQADKQNALDELRAASGRAPEQTALLAPGETWEDMAGVRLGSGSTDPKLSSALTALNAITAAGERVRGALPMDEASRMARAAEQGYTFDAFHGTGSPEFSAFDSSKVRDNIQYGGNFYFTPDAEFANKHTGIWSGDTPRVMPVKLKAENPFRLDQPVTAEQAAAVLSKMGRKEQAGKC